MVIEYEGNEIWVHSRTYSSCDIWEQSSAFSLATWNHSHGEEGFSERKEKEKSGEENGRNFSSSFRMAILFKLLSYHIYEMSLRFPFSLTRVDEEEFFKKKL